MTHIFHSRYRLFAVLPALLAITLSSPPAAAAGTPAAMIMAGTGATTPALPAMTEIPAQTSVTLGPGVSLTFILYARCKLVTVTGGTLILTGDDFSTNGQIASQQDTECPGRYDLREPGVASGEIPGVVRFRGAPGQPLRLTPNAQIVFSGDRADAVTGAALYPANHGPQPLFRYNLYYRRAIAPAGVSATMPNVPYVLSVTVSGQAAPVDVPVVGAPAGGSTFVVVRIN